MLTATFRSKDWVAMRAESGAITLVHLAAPRFVAKVIEIDDAGAQTDDGPRADLVAGFTIDLIDGLLLCQIAWIDPPAMDAAALHRIQMGALEAIAGLHLANDN